MSDSKRAARPSSIAAIGLTGAPAVPAAVSEETPEPQPPDMEDRKAPEQPPRRRHRQPREQFKTQLRPDVRARLDAFCAHHDAALQDVVEVALLAYFDRVGGA